MSLTWKTPKSDELIDGSVSSETSDVDQMSFCVSSSAVASSEPNRHVLICKVSYLVKMLTWP